MDKAILEREIIQTRLLAGIFSRSVKNQVVLKGGMAMRALFGSQRYTKDIDLAQNPSQSLAGLQKLMKAAIAESVNGFLDDVVVTTPKQTDTVARWKIHGKTRNRTEIALTVEVSRRGIPEGATVHETMHSVPDARTDTVMVDVYSKEAMLGSKIFALASDNRVAPRDLYDLDLLIRMEVRPEPALFAEIDDLDAFLLHLWNKIDLINWPQFEQEVLPYMPDAARSRIDRDAFEAMQVRVGSALDTWIGEEKVRRHGPR